MPKTENILSGLHSVANTYAGYAISWHAVIYLLLVLLLFKWTPSNRFFGIFMALPLVSVAVLAWISGNPFNGSLFALAAITVFILAILAPGQVALSPAPYFIAGILMVIIGMVYPHFLETNSVFPYLYASPFGLIPCPTLMVLIGFALMFNGMGSQGIFITLIILGLFYGLFGVLKLAVYLDIILLLGTMIFMARYFIMIRNQAF